MFCSVLFLTVFSVVALSTVKPVTGQTEVSISYNVTAPVQNLVYSNNVPLNFTCETNLDRIQEVLFVLNVDGETGYHGGRGVRLGNFTSIPPFFNTTIYFPDGNHTIWVDGFFWYYSDSGLACIERPSKMVKFFVNAEPSSVPSESVVVPTDSPSPPPPSPSPTIPEYSWVAIMPLFIATLLITAAQRKKSCKF
ncbi:MAG: hypothetical protein ACFCUE_08940 [Candidatus Bathyarchaeia archaeon]